MADRKPDCGPQGETTDDIGTIILFLLGLVGTIIGVVQGAIWTVEQAAAVSIIGISAPGAVWLGAIGGALFTWAVVATFYWDRCLSDPEGLDACAAGVVNEIEESFNSDADELFPFSAMHDRVDVVVKCDYWHLVEQNAQFVKCAGDPIGSPILQSFYHSAEVCGAGLGATIGGGIGAVGGIIAGALVGALVGCATVILCIFAILIAAIIAAAAVLAGAFIGGQIGKAAAENSQPTADGIAISIGDYLTVMGNLITSGNFDGARVLWFVENSTLHGRSSGSPQFSHTDPDTNLTMDACPSTGAIK